MKILIILGLPLSGKTTHAKEVNKLLDQDIPLVETGTFVFEAVEERGFDATPENIRQVVAECKEESDAYFTERALEHIQNTYEDSPLVFLSGVKAPSEVDLIKREIDNDKVFLISFHASVQTRHSRLLNKDRLESSKGGKSVEDKAMAADIDRFLLRNKKELSYGLGDLMALADYVVNTENELWPHNEFDQTIKDFKTIVMELIN